jgi:predicted RNA-binding protein with EMAP domain
MGLPIKKDLRSELGAVGKDMGQADTLRFNVLTYVVEENYEGAIRELKNFLERDSEYPKFRERVERYIQHAVDLVNAIRAKRKFPGAQMLTMAKQQELNEKFVSHFSELQFILKKVEHIQRDLRLEDIRSTVWIVKAAISSAIVIAVVAFLLDVNQGLMATTMIVVDDIFREFMNWMFKSF